VVGDTEFAGVAGKAGLRVVVGSGVAGAGEVAGCTVAGVTPTAAVDGGLTST
jgi:hypothetical protein